MSLFVPSLCLGSGRLPLSQRSVADIRLILLTPRSPSTKQECRDIKLRLLAELFDIMQKADKAELKDKEGLEPWYLARREGLEEVNRIQRFLLPLPGKCYINVICLCWLTPHLVVAEHDQHNFEATLVILRMCRCFLLYRTLEQARILLFTPGMYPAGFLSVRLYEQPILVPMGREVVQLTEAVLVTLLQIDVPTLQTAPDIFFPMTGFIAALGLAVKFMMIRNFGFELPGSSDAIMAKLPKHLLAASLCDHSMATFQSKFLDLLNQIWARRHIESSAENVGLTEPSPFANTSPPSSGTAATPSASSTSQSPSGPSDGRYPYSSYELHPPETMASPPQSQSSNNPNNQQYPDTSMSPFSQTPHTNDPIQFDPSADQYMGMGTTDFIPFQDYQTGGGGGDYTDGMFWGPDLNTAQSHEDPEFWAQLFNGVGVNLDMPAPPQR
jgi:hypothetical protein